MNEVILTCDRVAEASWVDGTRRCERRPPGWPVVLSSGFWKDYYGGAEDIIGKKMIASDAPVTNRGGSDDCSVTIKAFR